MEGGVARSGLLTLEAALRVVTAILLSLAMGCGGPPPAPLAPVAAPPPWQPPAQHPADAVAVVRLAPAAAARWLARFGAASPWTQGLTPVAQRLQAVPWAALGLADQRPLTVSVRSAPPTAVQRAAEDLSRVLADPPAGGLDAWLATHPLPPAWLHVRVVGAGAALDPQADQRLSDWLGALQRFALTEAPEVAAVSLEVAAGDLAALAPLGGSRFYRLLDSDLPTLLRVEPGAKATVVDVVIDLALGEGAFGAALGALPELQAKPTWAPALPIRAPGEWARGQLTLPRWAALVRAAHQAAALWTVLGENPLRVEPADALARALRDAERRSAPLSLEGAGAQITALGAGDGFSLEGEASRGLAGLRSQRSLPFEALAAAAPRVLAWRPPATAPTLPTPAHPWPTLLQGAQACGWPCAPALWPALAHGLGDPKVLGAALLPAGHPMQAALGGLQAVALGGEAAVTLTVLAVAAQAQALQAVVPEVQARQPIPSGEIWVSQAGPRPPPLAKAVAWAPAAHVLRAQVAGAQPARLTVQWTPQGQQRVTLTAPQPTQPPKPAEAP